MSAEPRAWSVEPATRTGRRRAARGGPSKAALRRGAFTLVELLVVVAIIAVVSSLLTPAVRGLLGVSGPRGGVNTMTAALEQARLAAMESGVPAYAGFTIDTNGGNSAVIVYREPREGEQADRPVPLTRWIRFPQGVYHTSDQLQNTNIPQAQRNFPKLGTNATAAISFVRFDRFGRLSPSTSPVVIELGAKTAETGDYLGSKSNYFEITIQPLTGRAVVVDKSMEGAR